MSLFTRCCSWCCCLVTVQSMHFAPPLPFRLFIILYNLVTQWRQANNQVGSAGELCPLQRQNKLAERRRSSALVLCGVRKLNKNKNFFLWVKPSRAQQQWSSSTESLQNPLNTYYFHSVYTIFFINLIQW